MNILLASQSPRRGELLEQLGVRYQRVLPSDPDAAEELERVLPNENPTAYVRRVTMLKLQAAQQAVQQQKNIAAIDVPILCADTTVTIDGKILGKPADEQEAAQVLRLLSGRTHQVVTAVAMGRANEAREVCQLQSVETTVRFRELTAQDVQWYMDSGEWQGKAGSYGIQGKAAAFIERIEGSYTGVVGLPLFTVDAMVKQYR